MARVNEGSSLSWSYMKYYFIPVELAVFLFMFAAYFSTGISQQYYYQQTARNMLNLSSNFSGCLNQSDIVEMSSNETFSIIQDNTNHLSLCDTIVSLVPSIVVVVVIGGFMDKFGRKPIMIFIFTGHIIESIVMILVTYFNLNMYLLLIGGFAGAITGGFGAILVAAYAYIADVTPKRWLTIRMGLIQFMLFIGAAASSASSISWLGSNGCDFHPTTWVMMAASVLSFLYVLILPESLTDERRNELLIKPKRGIKAWITGLKIYFLPSFLGIRKYWKLLVATAVMSLALINEFGIQQIRTYFLQNEPLEWPLPRISLYNTVILVAHCLTLLLMLPLMVILRFPDPLISLIGVLVAAGTITIYGFAQHSWPFWIIFIGGTAQSMEALVIPALRSLISKLVTPDDQGALFSFLGTIEIVVTTVSSLIYTNLYHSTGPLSQSITFWVAAGIWLITVPFIVLLLVSHFLSSGSTTTIPTGDKQLEGDNEKANLLVNSDANNILYD